MAQPAQVTTPTSSEALAAAPSVLLEKLGRRVKNFQSLISPSHSFQETTEAQVEHRPDRADLIGLIRSSSRSLCAAVDVAEALSEMGRPGQERTHEEGAALIAPAIEHIHKRTQAGDVINPAETRLLRVYAKANGGKLNFPAWFTATKNAFSLVGKMEDLPGPEAYLAASPSAGQSTAEMREDLAALKTEILRLRQSPKEDEGPSGDTTERTMRERDKIVSQMDRILSDLSDVQPEQVTACCERVKVEALVMPELTEAMLDLRRGIARALERLTLGSGEKEPITIQCTELIGQGGAFKEAAQYSLSPDSILGEDNKSENVAVLLEEYQRLHAALVKVYQQWTGHPPDRREQERRKTMLRLERGIGQVFLEDPEKSRAMLIALSDYRSPNIEHCMAKLLTAPTLESGARGSQTLRPYLNKLENIELLGQALSLLIRGSSESADIITDALKPTELRPVCDLGHAVRTRLAASDTRVLVRLFDDELISIQRAAHTTPARKAVALHALALAADDESVRRGLKGRLKALEYVDKLASSLNENARERSPHAQFIEKVRARISRRFSSDLSDYWGQRELVRDWRSLLEDHLTLLAHPDAWNGLVPNQVFYNGYLLYGEPGAGKSFLVLCMANDLEIPLHTISREEMAQAYQEADRRQRGYDRGAKEQDSRSQGNEIEDTLSKFLESKIEQANTDKRKSGARACMLFIDEMEAEFLKRDPETSPREELTRTNIMLRVIERLIKKHPDIIFVAATNHIDLVDEAALRLGRYGCHLEVKLPQEADVKDILDGCFDRLGFTINNQIKQSDGYQQLVNSCIRMSPLDIQLAINNAATLERIRREESFPDLDEGLLKLFISKIEATKKLDGRRRILKGSSSETETHDQGQPAVH
ncbi:MAG: AAA family ATPase [Deltaproteobacteria bacterium]|nr:AAA family ATPase [Deltaproteobacteria bacterium]